MQTNDIALFGLEENPQKDGKPSKEEKKEEIEEKKVLRTHPDWNEEEGMIIVNGLYIQPRVGNRGGERRSVYD